MTVEDLIQRFREHPLHYGVKFELEVRGAGDEYYRARRQEFETKYEHGNLVLVLRR